ncbi:MAG: peptide chain release factor N(5)-glutamine methyltransferase [Deltaproteobacteria bacterium]|nr:peptide chain release factor N(5)-glutamine methyltransferase [Deltaproteobacteria bacterium]
MSSWTLISLLNWTTDYFTRRQIPTPRLDAEVLLAHLLNIERIQLYLQFERPMSEKELSDFKALVQRRVKGEPVSYIRGFKEFWSLSFAVGPGVMVPRPETEILVETVEGRRSKIEDGRSKIEILDVGTGSGNLAITLAKVFPNAKVTAIDVSEDALKYAKENAVANGVQSRIEFIKNDFFTIHDLRPSIFNLLVSNPPYIPTKTIETLPAGVRDYEPRIALDGGADGLDFYQKIGETAPRLLKPGGWLAVEIGEDQPRAVKEIFERAGLSDIEVVKDYAGLPRVVIAWTK